MDTQQQARQREIERRLQLLLRRVDAVEALARRIVQMANVLGGR